MKIIWSQFKSVCTSRTLNIQMSESEGAYYLEAWDGPKKYTSSVQKSDPTNSDQDDFEDNFLINVNKPISNKTTDSKLKVSNYEPEGSAATIVSHCFADKCSWYHGAATSTSEVLSPTTARIFQSAHTHWIDMEHGRAYDEDNLVLEDPSLIPKIYIDEVLQETGYEIAYETGVITFDSDISGEVTADYKYADKSWFIIKPKLGKVLTIKAAEVQFTHNVTLQDHFIFEAWVNHPTYGMIPVPGTRIAYKNARDFISACNEGQGLVPKWGELANDVHVFPFHYARPKSIKYSSGAEIRVYCKNHNPVLGEFATATFYVSIDNE